MDVHGLYSFFGLFWVKQTRDDPLFSEADFGVGTNSRLITLNTAGSPVSYKLGPRWDVVVTRSDFKSKPILDSSPQTTRGKVLVFCKT